MDCDSIQEWCVLLHGHSAIQRFFFCLVILVLLKNLWLGKKNVTGYQEIIH